MLRKPGVQSHGTNPENISITGLEHVYANGFVGKRMLIMQGTKIPDWVDIEKMDPNCVLIANFQGGIDRQIWPVMVDLVIEAKQSQCKTHEWLFLSVDGFDAHLYDSKCLQELKDNHVILFQERANCSDAIQALDLTIFSPYSNYEKHALKLFRNKCGSLELSQWHFPYLYKCAMDLAQTEENIASGFKKAGLFLMLTFSEWRSGPGKSVKLVDCTKKNGGPKHKSHHLKEKNGVMIH